MTPLVQSLTDFSSDLDESQNQGASPIPVATPLNAIDPFHEGTTEQSDDGVAHHSQNLPNAPRPTAPPGSPARPSTESLSLIGFRKVM